MLTRKQQRDQEAQRQFEALDSTMMKSKGPSSPLPAGSARVKMIGSHLLLSPIKPTADPASIEGLVGFLDLPGEVRNIIYKLVFKGAKFKVSSRPNPRFTNSDSGDEAEDAYLYKTRCFGCTRALLQTCKSIRAEARPILSDATKLIVHKIYERRSPIHQIPSVYIRGIKSLEVEVNAFIWVPRECLPALEWVCLDHHPNDEFGQIEHLASYDHGEQEQQHLITVMTADIQDWKWKCKQFLRLAEEENFTIQLFVSITTCNVCTLNFSVDMADSKVKGSRIICPMGSRRNFKTLSRFRDYYHDLMEYLEDEVWY